MFPKFVWLFSVLSTIKYLTSLLLENSGLLVLIWNYWFKQILWGGIDGGKIIFLMFCKSNEIASLCIFIYMWLCELLVYMCVIYIHI